MGQINLKKFINYNLLIITIIIVILVSNTSEVLIDRNKYILPEEILTWYSPNGEKPGTFEEYITKHPYQKTEFFQPILQSKNSIKNEDLGINNEE